MQTSTTHHTFKTIFSLDAPSVLVRNDKYDMFQLIDPDDELAAITASAYEKDGGTLDEFSEFRFAGVESVYKPVSDIQTIETKHAIIKFQEYEGTFPDEDVPTYFVVNCIQTGDIFLSVTFVTTREHYTDYRDQYNAVLASIQPCTN
jgi:hypothetical protein